MTDRRILRLRRACVPSRRRSARLGLRITAVGLLLGVSMPLLPPHPGPTSLLKSPGRPRIAVVRDTPAAAARADTMPTERPSSPSVVATPAPRAIERDELAFARRAVKLPSSDDYDLRCPSNSYAAPFTADNLRLALSRLRTGYPGQLVVGDISRKYGGHFGRHRSHDTGRDVDIWLPIIGGLYRTSPTCASCGTNWCRPEPEEVDWRTTWSLIEALAETGAVERVLLDRSLHPRLRDAGVAAGAGERAVERTFQARPGAPAFVLHSSGHTRHIHVRFACGPNTPDCEDLDASAPIRADATR